MCRNKKYSNLDVARLMLWLKTLTKDDFDRGVDDNLLSATHIEDLKHFHEEDKANVKGSEIVIDDEPFLVDLYNGALCIVTYSKKQLKAPNGRMVNLQLHVTLFNMMEVYGAHRNGYWKIPERFFN